MRLVERNPAMLNSAEQVYASDPEHPLIDPGATLRHLETPLSTVCPYVCRNRPPLVTFTLVLRAKGASCIIIPAVES